jgi:membrane protein YdbS with pleckstrin-like domain
MMTLQKLRPEREYLTKLQVVYALIGLIALGGSLALAVPIGLDAGGTRDMTIGIVVAVLVNAAWLIPAFIVAPFYYRSLEYQILEDEVIVYAGVWTKSVKHVPYRTVTNLKVKRDPFDRMLGMGTVEIQTAGISGQAGAEASLVGLSNVQEVCETVSTALRRFKGAMAPTQAEVEAVSMTEAEVLSALLDEVRAIRCALSEKE